MRKFNFLTFILLIFVSGAIAQNTFPEISGKTLSDKTISIPKSTNGKFTLVGMAYSKKSEDNLKTWFQPIYTTFIQQQEGGLFPQESYDVNIYFIPMITGIKQSAGDKIEDKMKKNVDKELHAHVLLYEGELKPYKDQLKMTEKDEPYFFVLDDKGKIVYNCSGAFNQKKLEKILEIIEE
jgi:hypothetical protein